MWIVAQSLNPTPSQLLAKLHMPSTAGESSGPVELKLEATELPGEWRKEFTVMLPGKYRIELGTESRSFQVESQEYLTFGHEFGMFSAVVLLLVGGMLLWIKMIKKRNKSNGRAGSA